MPLLDQFIIADSVSRNPGGTVDIFGGSWDEVEAPTVPLQSSFALLLSLLLTREETQGEHTLAVVVNGPDGEPLSRFKNSIPAVPPDELGGLPEGDLARLETVLNASGVVFPEFGRYEIDILWDGEPLRPPMRFKVSQSPVEASSGVE